MYSYELSQVICNSRFTVKKKRKKLNLKCQY